MSDLIDILVPNIGDFEDVEVIEILVAPGDPVARDDSLISIESDKATLEVPAPRAGTVREIVVALGDAVSEGSVILKLEVDDSPAAAPGEPSVAAAQPAASETPADAGRPPAASTGRVARARPDSDAHFEVVVLGGGPGGYTAAFRAADLGKRVALIERYATLGGVCLNVGCIPSKALLHVAEIVNDARDLKRSGIEFGEPKIDLAGLSASRDRTIARLTRGLDGLAKQREVEVLRGSARFIAPDQLALEGESGATTISFDDVIVAAGSRPVEIPNTPGGDPRLMDSTDALRLDEIPARLLVIGGGIIGLEMATVYAALGTAITVVEMTGTLIPECDRDLVQPLQRRISRSYENIFLNTRVARIEPEAEGLRVELEGDGAPDSDRFDRVLVCVGRRPNTDLISAESAGLRTDERGFLPVDSSQRTNVDHIYAVGDIAGPPMLAHKAMHEGRVAAEVIAGLPAAFDTSMIPSVAYTDPEIAWVGLTEAAAGQQGIPFEKGAIPWSANGRSLSMGRSDGVTKILVDPETRRVLGAGMVGRHAGDLVSEAVLALEMGADAEDIGLSIHPHPTLSETFALAAEMVEGTITDLYAPREKK